jgi:hypothetical protein
MGRTDLRPAPYRVNERTITMTRSIGRRFLTAAAITLGILGLAGGAAGAASASVTHPHIPPPSACRATMFSHDRLTLTDGTTNFVYRVNLHLTPAGPIFNPVEVVSGALCDTYEPIPIALPVHGVVFGDNVVFSVAYPSTGPDAGDQGVRTFSGVIGPWGQVSGSWSETGTEAGSGPFTLDRI